MPAGNPEAYGALAAMASPSASPTEPVLSPEAMGPEEEMETGAEDEDKLMLVDDFRNAPPEDALAAFEALLAAFNVKRS